MECKKGILLLAMDSPYYGSWCWNLAAGIKQSNPEAKISIAYKGDALRFIQPNLSIFDKKIEIPDHCITRNGLQAYLRAKTCLYELSPYDSTIYIDADVIWFYNKSIDNLWKEVEGADFTMGCRGVNDLNQDPRMIWCKAEELKTAHNTNNVYNLSSEFIYFKKTKSAKEFFELSQKYFDSPMVDYNMFSGTVPDELAFQIAMMHSEIKPHKENFLPFYWEPFHKMNLQTPMIYDREWYGYSIGGNSVTTTQKYIYDGLAELYARNFGVKYPYKAYSKKDVIKFREKV